MKKGLISLLVIGTLSLAGNLYLAKKTEDQKHTPAYVSLEEEFLRIKNQRHPNLLKSIELIEETSKDSSSELIRKISESPKFGESYRFALKEIKRYGQDKKLKEIREKQLELRPNLGRNLNLIFLMSSITGISYGLAACYLME